ncbi:hypothetical protein SAMD00023353_7300320 [Rosellinia necatrix]|uniref:Uncharacterized protein n=1 Tax=Rosellinia necatrix TaxID=77044 RepID=A0A1S8ABR6_ROSNE|nr:hypothetical protein SAMD00023353_7300320 [Rosellinia necatrix]
MASDYPGQLAFQNVVSERPHDASRFRRCIDFGKYIRAVPLLSAEETTHDVTTIHM